jgi:predicted transcriptional regulator
MSDKSLSYLSRREQQIMDIILRLGRGTVSDVHAEIGEDINYSTVRALMKILEDKGQLKHEKQGTKYVYYPAVSRKSAEKKAIMNLLKTFFNNSTEQAVSALIELDKSKLTDEDFGRLSEIIKKAREADEQHE